MEEKGIIGYDTWRYFPYLNPFNFFDRNPLRMNLSIYLFIDMEIFG